MTLVANLYKQCKVAQVQRVNNTKQALEGMGVDVEAEERRKKEEKERKRKEQEERRRAEKQRKKRGEEERRKSATRSNVKRKPFNFDEVRS